jgi:tyrosinase
MSTRRRRSARTQSGRSRAAQKQDRLTLERFPTREEVSLARAHTATDRPERFHGPHPMFDHFPSREELRSAEARLGLVLSPNPEITWRRFERQLSVLRFEAIGKGLISSTELSRWDLVTERVRPWFVKLLAALLRSRVDHRSLSAQARQQFNDAVQHAHGDGSYQGLAAVHSDMSHRMHSMSGAVGTQRFLPWHRIYTLKMEDLLRSKKPSLTIPYWNYAEDSQRPDWVWKPPQVSRRTPGAAGGSLPSKTTVDNLVYNTSGYTDFTEGVEFDAHNQVHNWCNGTISTPATAAKDPIFWLLHSNVDRMWDLWQLNHTGTPSLSGADAVMDPWTQTAGDAEDVINLGYSYA